MLCIEPESARFRPYREHSALRREFAEALPLRWKNSYGEVYRRGGLFWSMTFVAAIRL